MKYPKFCEIYPGGTLEAEKWLISKMLLNEDELCNIYQTGTELVTWFKLISVVSNHFPESESVLISVPI
jgi:hypothetical protein